MTNETIIELAKLTRVISLKDASGDIARPTDLLPHLPNDFTILSGEDATLMGLMAQGAMGLISTSGNVAPGLISEQCRAWACQDFARAAEIRDLLNPLHDAMFVESSPGPAKYALSRMGLCEPTVRRPLIETTPEANRVIDQAISHAGLSYAPNAGQKNG